MSEKDALTPREFEALARRGYKPAGGDFREGVGYPAFRLNGQRIVKSRAEWRALLATPIETDELPFMKRLRQLVEFKSLGCYDADQLVEDIRFLLADVDWLRTERDRLHKRLDEKE